MINSNATTINKNNHSKKSTIRLKSSRKIFKDSRKKKGNKEQTGQIEIIWQNGVGIHIQKYL